MTMDLVGLYRKLPAIRGSYNSGTVFSAVPIPHFPRHRVAKGPDGLPALLLSTASSGPEPRLPVSLAHIGVLNSAECAVIGDDGNHETGRFAVLQCRSLDPTMHSYFLKVSAALVEMLGQAPSQAEVNFAIERLVDLFRALEEPRRKEVRGLWAELLVIHQSSDPATLITAWHQDPSEKFDFSDGRARLEVKSNNHRRRQHAFSLEQVRPPSGITAVIASVCVERSAGGLSIRELIESVARRMRRRPDLEIRLQEVVGLTLGQDIARGISEPFDFELAADTLCFFEANKIPAPCDSAPPGVNAITFNSDLEALIPLDLCDNTEPLFEAARVQRNLPGGIA